MQGKPLRLGIARVRQRVWNARRRLRLVPRNNVTYNRELWDRYSRNWDDPRFRKTQIDPSLGASANPAEFEIVGEEWAPSADVDAIVAEFIEPFVSAESTAVEIGVGGGRIAERVAPMVALLVCLDISARMLERANVALAAHPNVEFGLLDGARLPPELSGQVDFVYSFDVFLHLDLHTMWKYVREMSRSLRPGGRALVHTTNLTAPAGWEMFAGQDSYSVEYGWFVSPEIVRTLAARANLAIVKESAPDASNLYLNRDYLAVLERRG